jgi:hypothetical protein
MLFVPKGKWQFKSAYDVIRFVGLLLTLPYHVVKELVCSLETMKFLLDDDEDVSLMVQRASEGIPAPPGWVN